MLVPRALYIAGVSFPLEAGPGGARLAIAVPALEPAQLILARLCNADVTAEQRGLFERGEDWSASQLTALHLRATSPGVQDGIAAWKAFAKRPIGDDLYLLSASFIRHSIAMPRQTLVRLMNELALLCDGIRDGSVEPRLASSADSDDDSDSDPDPDSDSDSDSDPDSDPDPDPDSDPDPDPDSDSDEARDAAYAAALGLATAPAASSRTAAAPKASPDLAALADDSILRELENSAVMLDQLDPEDTLRDGLPSEDLDALTAARRRILLLGLRTAGLFSPELLAPAAERATPSPSAPSAALRARLLAASMPTLVGYLDAAISLTAYLASPARAEHLPPPPVADLLAATVSLDWFRKTSPRAAAAPSLSADDWLARCEAAFLRTKPRGPRAGRTFAKIANHSLWLHFRADLGPHVSLWRALPAVTSSGLR